MIRGSLEGGIVFFFLAALKANDKADFRKEGALDRRADFRKDGSARPKGELSEGGPHIAQRADFRKGGPSYCAKGGPQRTDFRKGAQLLYFFFDLLFFQE